MRTALRLALLAVLASGGAPPLAAQETHLVVVVGLPGQDIYRERFHGWAASIRDAAVDRLGVRAENVIWLADDTAAAPGRIRARATVAALRTAISDIAGRAGPADRVLLVLIGHGTSNGDEARFNLSGPDLTPTELDALLDRLAPRPVGVVHTGSASGEFVPALSAPGRTVITATRNGRESNETWFAGFFAEALAGDGSDLDKDGRVSLLEAFEYARRGVEGYFEEKNLLATEHALLDDDGNGEGTMEPGEAAADGAGARAFHIGGPPVASAARRDRPATDDPELTRLYEEQAALEQRVAAHRLRRAQMDAAAYEAELEAMLVELALTTRAIRERGGMP